MIAGPKHFAGYGAALGGRDYDEVNLSDSELWNVYFPPFAAAHRGGRRQHHDRLHGPQRHPRDRQPLAVHRGPARRRSGFEGFVVSDANAVRNLVTHGFAADLPDAGARALQRRRATWRWRSPTRPTRHLPEARRAGRGQRRRRSTRACGACWRPSCALGLFEQPVRRRGARPRGARRSRPPRGGPDRGRALGRAAAQRGRPAAARPPAPGSIAVHRPAGRLPARHARPVVLRLRPRRDRDGARRHHGPGRRRRAVRYAPGVRPAQRVFPSMFDMFGDNAPEDPADFDDEAELARGRRAGARRRRRRRGGRRVAEHDRRGRLAVLAGAARAASSSCCRPWSPPARRSCCW